MEQEVSKALSILKKGGLILYPTDTVWGIGCDATNYDAVEKIYQLKKRHETKSMICIVSDFKMLNQYIENIPEVAFDIIKYASKPTTVIYDKPLRVAENLVPKDNTLAIRVIRKGFSNKLLKRFKKPIVSTSANISNEPTPNSFKQISSEILKGVDYVVNLPNECKNAKPSSIIKLSNDGIVNIIRE